MMAGYDIYFASILWYELHERAFGEMTNPLFSDIIQKLCNKSSVLELPGIDEDTCNHDCVYEDHEGSGMSRNF